MRLVQLIRKRFGWAALLQAAELEREIALVHGACRRLIWINPSAASVMN
jgi:uncharacterized protein with von Willebrand factor type A (vWA) domain